MYSNLVRITLIAVGVLAGAAFIARGLVGGWLFLLMAVLLVVGWWRTGRVGQAWRAYVKGDLPGVERHLDAIRTPERLGPQQEAYYHFLRGVLARSRNELAAARERYQRALSGLRTARDRAFAEAHLAEVALASGDHSTARDHLARAEANPTSRGVARLVQELRVRLEERFPPGPERPIPGPTLGTEK